MECVATVLMYPICEVLKKLGGRGGGEGKLMH